MPSPNSFGDIDSDEVKQWDPNDPKIFEVTRDAPWLLETWKVYVKRKYKTALDKWNKDTGGGNGQSWSFINYCERDARWLVVVFLKDVECNYLLAANAGGRMPAHLQMELSSDGSSDEAVGSRLTAKKREIIESQKETKKLKADIADAVSLLSTICKGKQEVNKTDIEDEKDRLFIGVEKVNRTLNDQGILNSMSPTTRDTYVTVLKAKRRRLVKKMQALEEQEEEA